MIIRNNENLIDNLSARLDKRVRNRIENEINLNKNINNRGASNMRGGMLYFSAFAMKNIVSHNYATFGGVGGGGNSVGP